MKLYARSIVEQQHTQPTVHLPFQPSLPEHMGRDLQKQQPKIAASLRGRLRARVSNVPATMPAFQQHSNCSSLHVGEKFSFLIFYLFINVTMLYYYSPTDSSFGPWWRGFTCRPNLRCGSEGVVQGSRGNPNTCETDRYVVSSFES